MSAGDNSPVQVTQTPPPPAQRLNKDDSSFTNQTWQLQPIFRPQNQRADQLDLNMTQMPHYLRKTRHVSRVQNSYLNSRFSLLSSLLTVSSHWLQPSRMISVTMFILMLACLVPVQDTSQQVKLNQFLPQQVKSTHSHHPGIWLQETARHTHDPAQRNFQRSQSALQLRVPSNKVSVFLAIAQKCPKASLRSAEYTNTHN